MAGVPQKTLSWLYDVLKRVEISGKNCFGQASDIRRNIAIRVEHIRILRRLSTCTLVLHLGPTCTVGGQMLSGRG